VRFVEGKVGMELSIIQGKAKHVVTVPADGTFGAVKEQVQELAGIRPAAQKLIFKGKERKDADSLASAGVASGAKMMLMLSAEGAKDEKKAEEQRAKQKRQHDAMEAKQLLEEHRAGGSEHHAAGTGDGADSSRAAPAPAVIEEEGASAAGAHVVQVLHGKMRFRLVVGGDGAGGAAPVTFGDLKEKLAKLCSVPPAHQRLIYKAKERDSAHAIKEAGVKDGDKLMLLLAEGEWKARDEQTLIRDVANELAEVEADVSKLRSQCEHGLFGDDTMEISVKAGAHVAAVERLSDNVSYLSHVPEAAAVRDGFTQRLKTVSAALDDLQALYVLGRHTAKGAGGSLYQRLDGPGL